jgi:hypothetical protein
LYRALRIRPQRQAFKLFRYFRQHLFLSKPCRARNA